MVAEIVNVVGPNPIPSHFHYQSTTCDIVVRSDFKIVARRLPGADIPSEIVRVDVQARRKALLILGQKSEIKK